MRFGTRSSFHTWITLMETEMMFFLSLLADKPFEDDTDPPKTLLILHYKNAIRRVPLTAKFIRSRRSARGARVKSIDQRHPMDAPSVLGTPALQPFSIRCDQSRSKWHALQLARVDTETLECATAVVTNIESLMLTRLRVMRPHFGMIGGLERRKRAREVSQKKRW